MKACPVKINDGTDGTTLDQATSAHPTLNSYGKTISDSLGGRLNFSRQKS